MKPTSDIPRISDYSDRLARTEMHGRRSTGELPSVDADGPLVSVVTAVRDGAVRLQRAMESVFSQDYRRVEYIVVDGQSSDGTQDILRRNDNRIAAWISEPDRGISDAFNKGIALARGDIVGLLNCDDWYEPAAIGAVVAAMARTGADIACGGLQYWEGDRPTYLVWSDPALLLEGMTIGHPTTFVRRDCYVTHGLFRLDFRLAMDYEWLARAMRGGAKFVAVDACLANMQGGGLGDRRWRDSQREVARARALHVAGADTAWAYHAYVARAVCKGSARRALDAIGLGAVRRLYHRWFSPVKTTLRSGGRSR